MIEDTDVNAAFRDIEAMVRAAGGYLEVSDDLRPRTVEEARYERRETSTRCWIAVLAVVVVFLAMQASEFRGRLSCASPLKEVVSADCNHLYAAARQKAAKTKDESWSLVDAFNELRLRQARVIEDAI